MKKNVKKAKGNEIYDTFSRIEVITEPKEKWRQLKSLTFY